MRKKPKEIERRVIHEIVSILQECGEPMDSSPRHFESPDFLVESGGKTIGFELVSYSVDFDASADGKARSMARKRYFSGEAPLDTGGWISVSGEIVELIKDKAASYGGYINNAKCDECWLVIHSENVMPYEELGTRIMAPLQNINFSFESN